MRLIFVIYILSTTRVGTRPVTSQFFFFFFFFIFICKIPKFWFNNQYLKKENKAEKKEKDLNRAENFEMESRYLKLCYEFRAFIKGMKAAFYVQTRYIRNSKCVRWSKDSAKLLFEKIFYLFIFIYTLFTVDSI